GPAERRDDDDSAGRHHRGEFLGHRQPVHSGKLDVEQRDVGGQALRRFEGVVAATDCADDLDVVLEREQRRKRITHHRLVFDEKNADHGLAGTRATTLNPPCVSSPASSVPPTAAIRSRKPAMPEPSTPAVAAPVPSSTTSRRTSSPS